MVVQVLADAWPFERNRNAVLAQLRRRADAGEQQQVRRPDAAGGKNDVMSAGAPQPPVLPPFDPRGAAAAELDALYQAADFEAQVGRLQCRLKKAAGRRPPPPALLV